MRLQLLSIGKMQMSANIWSISQKWNLVNGDQIDMVIYKGSPGVGYRHVVTGFSVYFPFQSDRKIHILVGGNGGFFPEDPAAMYFQSVLGPSDIKFESGSCLIPFPVDGEAALHVRGIPVDQINGVSLCLNMSGYTEPV